MNNSIVKVLVAGRRIGSESDSPRELVPTLVSRPALDSDEFSLKGYIRSLEETLNDPDTSDEEYEWTLQRVAFLRGYTEWDVSPWDSNKEYEYVHL